MQYYDVGNAVTVELTNMIDKMACDYGTLRTSCVRTMAPSLQSLAKLRRGISYSGYHLLTCCASNGSRALFRDWM